MAINTTTVSANLTTKLNNTSGTTDAKEFLLLGKAVEALTPSVTVQDVIDEGDTQIARVEAQGDIEIAAVQAAGSNFVTTAVAASTYAPLAGATFTGGISGTTATFSGDVSAVGGTYSGNLSAVDLVLSGNLTVNGTQTVLNTSTLTVDDLNITVADGAANAAAANGAGITIGGANVGMSYNSSIGTLDFSAPVSGTYKKLHAEIDNVAGATGTQTFDVSNPMHVVTMSGNCSFSGVSIANGRTCMMRLDRTSSGHTPTWSSDIKWPDATEPTWSDYQYWVLNFHCLNSVTILASAQGYTV